MSCYFRTRSLYLTQSSLEEIHQCYAEGGPRAYVGHLTSIAFPTLGNLTNNLDPRVGTLAFFARRNRSKSHHPMCSSVCSTAMKALEERLFLMEDHLFLYLYKTVLITTHFQHCLMEHLTLWGLCGLLMIGTRFSTGNQALEVY